MCHRPIQSPLRRACAILASCKRIPAPLTTMGTDFHAHARAIIEAVLNLPPLPNEPRYIEASDRIYRACQQYMLAYQTERDAVRQGYLRLKLRQKNLGRRIVELAGGGLGVRQIARVVGVNPSTVSRRLRRTL